MARLLDAYDRLQGNPLGTTGAMAYDRSPEKTFGTNYKALASVYGGAVRALKRQARRGDVEAAQKLPGAIEKANAAGFTVGGIPRHEDVMQTIGGRFKQAGVAAGNLDLASTVAMGGAAPVNPAARPVGGMAAEATAGPATAAGGIGGVGGKTVNPSAYSVGSKGQGGFQPFMASAATAPVPANATGIGARPTAPGNFGNPPLPGGVGGSTLMKQVAKNKEAATALQPPPANATGVGARPSAPGNFGNPPLPPPVPVVPEATPKEMAFTRTMFKPWSTLTATDKKAKEPQDTDYTKLTDKELLAFGIPEPNEKPTPQQAAAAKELQARADAKKKFVDPNKKDIDVWNYLFGGETPLQEIERRMARLKAEREAKH